MVKLRCSAVRMQRFTVYSEHACKDLQITVQITVLTSERLNLIRDEHMYIALVTDHGCVVFRRAQLNVLHGQLPTRRDCTAQEL